MATSPDRVPKPPKKTALAVAAIMAANNDEPNKKKFKKDSADAAAAAAAHSAALAAAAAGGNNAAAKIAAALSSTPEDEDEDAADWEPAPAAAAAAAVAAVAEADGGIEEPIKPKNDVGAAHTRELFTAFSIIKKLEHDDFLQNHFSNDDIYKFLGMDRPVDVQIAERDIAFKSIEFKDFKAMKKNRNKIVKTAIKKSSAGRPKKNKDECAFSIISVKNKFYLLSDDNSVFSNDTHKKIGTLVRKINNDSGDEELSIKPI